MMAMGTPFVLVPLKINANFTEIYAALGNGSALQI